jgi:hypothetical protein
MEGRTNFSFLFFWLDQNDNGWIQIKWNIKPYKIDPKIFFKKDPTKTTIKLRLVILNPGYNMGPKKSELERDNPGLTP